MWTCVPLPIRFGKWSPIPNMAHADVLVVIPAYEPDDELPRLVEALHRKAPLIVVNDGSTDARVFDRLPSDVTVLAHERNQGKGAALKTAFRYALAHYPDLVGVVTVDADGQHLPEDALKVARCIRERPSAMTFGARRFGREVPLRNRLGNVLTKYAMDAFLNIRLSDTQTGLRGIPKELLTAALELPFNRYEFEAAMILRARNLGIAFEEVAIRTVYSRSAAKRSHFLPIVDSMRIYTVLLRHVLAGLLPFTRRSRKCP